MGRKRMPVIAKSPKLMRKRLFEFEFINLFFVIEWMMRLTLFCYGLNHEVFL